MVTGTTVRYNEAAAICGAPLQPVDRAAAEKAWLFRALRRPGETLEAAKNLGFLLWSENSAQIKEEAIVFHPGHNRRAKRPRIRCMLRLQQGAISRMLPAENSSAARECHMVFEAAQDDLISKNWLKGFSIGSLRKCLNPAPLVTLCTFAAPMPAP